MSKDRIILLQKQLSVAKRALEKLALSYDQHGIAREALDNIAVLSLAKTYATIKPGGE